MKNIIHLLFISLTIIFLVQCSGKEKIELAKPSPKQIAFADWEVGAFIHFGMNVYSGQEHGDGRVPPSNFNPTKLDAEQWVRTAKSLGAKYACLTVRHEGGFCLWPSESTDYTIASSPYKNGTGDIAREFVDACRKHEIKVGFYHTSSHDANSALSWYDGKIGWGPNRDSLVDVAFQDKGRYEKYLEIQKKQFTELLTNYGPIDYMWSDHWGCSGSKDIWPTITDMAAELQPNMVFMGQETWVPGNERGLVVYPMWNSVHTLDGTNYTRPAANKKDVTTGNDYGLLEGAVHTGHPLGDFWRIRECPTNTAFHRGGWFWHPEITVPRNLSDHIDLYYRTVGLGANVIINLPPDTLGLIPDTIVTAAINFGQEIKNRFSNPIAETNQIKKGSIVEISWEEPKEINTVVLMENIANGQKVIEYTLEAWIDGKWQALKSANNFPTATSPYNPNPGFKTIGHKKIDKIDPVLTKKVRFHCLKSVIKPIELKSMSVYNCAPY